MRYNDEQLTAAFETLRSVVIDLVTDDAKAKALRSAGTRAEKEVGVNIARATATGAAIIVEQFFGDVSRIASSLEILAQNSSVDTGKTYENTPEGVFWNPAKDDFCDAMGDSCGVDFRRVWYYKRPFFPFQVNTVEPRTTNNGDPMPEPIPEGWFFWSRENRFVDKFGAFGDADFVRKWRGRMHEFPRHG